LQEIAMQKFMLSALAGCALCLSGAIHAQDGGAECQAGSAWGPKPGCGAGPSPGTANPYADQRAWIVPQDSQATAAAPYAAYGYGNRAYGPNAHDRENPRFYERHERGRRANRDRDGDGVPDRYDRYPDDPRYR
jgi:hypothetical protein